MDPAGCAARNGAKAAIVERFGYPGGQATGGLVILIVGIVEGEDNICNEIIRDLLALNQAEMVGKSVIPVAFWYFSLAGGAALFTYALHRKDPVFIVGQGAGLFIYLRNLYFIFRDRRPRAEKGSI